MSVSKTLKELRLDSDIGSSGNMESNLEVMKRETAEDIGGMIALDRRTHFMMGEE
jgi:hypothetical protein